MDEVLSFMVNKEWQKDEKKSRKLELLNAAREGRNSDEMAQKIGSVLLYSQVIDQFLKESIISSVAYVKAEIWPTEIRLQLNLEEMTLGRLIEAFKQYSLKNKNQDLLIGYLKEYNPKRNRVVHKLLSEKDLKVLLNEIEEYNEMAEKIILVLIEYRIDIKMYFYDLEDRVDFDMLFESFAKEDV